MTKDAIRSELRRRLSEYFDGYVLIGKVAGSKDVVIAVQCNDDNQPNLEVAMVEILRELQHGDV